jgi:hypothetical protein
MSFLFTELSDEDAALFPELSDEDRLLVHDCARDSVFPFGLSLPFLLGYSSP